MSDSIRACKTPLVDLLRSVPIHYRAEIHNGPYSTHFIPVGAHCHDAANEIARLEALATQQSATVSVPDRRPERRFLSDHEQGYLDGWNDCVDEYRRLNASPAAPSGSDGVENKNEQ